MYPPARDKQTSLGGKCEEFDLQEVNRMADQLPGLPVCIEHDMSKLVGKVECARVTHSGSVEVTARVCASTELGKQAIRDILDKKLIGLSLSHSYDLDVKQGSQTAHQINVAVCNGADWRATGVDGNGHSVQKQLCELSLCADPAREGCYVHDVFCASAAAARARSSSKKTTDEQQASRINTPPPGATVEDADIRQRYIGVFSCSSTAAPTTAMEATPLAEPSTAAAVAPAAGATEQTNVVHPAADVAAPVASVVAGQARDAAGRYVAASAAQPTESVQPTEAIQASQSAEPAQAAQPTEEVQPAEPSPAEPAPQAAEPASSAIQHASAEEIRAATESAEAMKMAMDQLQAVQAEVAQMREEHAAQLKAEQDKAAAKEQELQAEKAASAKLQESLDTEAKKALEAARAARNEVFKQLQTTLGNFAQPGTNNTVINQAQPDAGATLNPEQAKLAAETNTMEQAIKQLMSSTEQVATMQQNNEHLKRKQSGIASALTGFNGMSMPTGIKVNASAEDNAAPCAKRQCKSDFLEWRSANPNATWRQVNSFYMKSMNHAANGMSAHGMVNASKGPWSAARLQEAPAPSMTDFNCCHAGALHPELFNMIQEYNTGKMPSSSATMQLAEEGKRVYDIIASGRNY